MLALDTSGNIQVVVRQAKSVAWGHAWNELALFNYSKIRYQFLLKQTSIKLCHKKQSQTLDIHILACCYTIAFMKFPVRQLH